MQGCFGDQEGPTSSCGRLCGGTIEEVDLVIKTKKTQI